MGRTGSSAVEYRVYRQRKTLHQMAAWSVSDISVMVTIMFHSSVS